MQEQTVICTSNLLLKSTAEDWDNDSISKVNSWFQMLSTHMKMVVIAALHVWNPSAGEAETDIPCSQFSWLNYSE